MSRHPWLNLLVRWTIIAVGVALSAWIVPGITYDDGVTLLIVVALLSLFNAILKPLLVIFTLPFVVLSLGLGIWLINAFLFLAVGRLVPGFHVRDFWAALWGSLIVSLTNMVLSGLLRTRNAPPARPPPRSKPDDVIDI
ncbi:MAG TPA: phage holin family protein [Opitutaceae bacterium]|jgi:putative membrane protein|nr:phage holin family protein [Opitutaceae bacterium]